jgi:hypothetical protein
MSVEHLRQLVLRYISGDLDYGHFRAQFVADFLSVRHADALLERLSNAIESFCSDLSQGHPPDELRLKSCLARAAFPVLPTSVQAVNRIDVVFDAARSVVLSDAWWTITNANAATLDSSTDAIATRNAHAITTLEPAAA